MYDRDKHKHRVAIELIRRGLGSFMNNTKWRELVAAIGTLPFPPPYQRKDVLSNAAEPETFDSDVWYWGDWHEGIQPYFSIEWIRIRPRYLKRTSLLLPNELVDCGDALELALAKLHQKYEKVQDSIYIYGYR